jgi:hypothetical protein
MPGVVWCQAQAEAQAHRKTFVSTLDLFFFFHPRGDATRSWIYRRKRDGDDITIKSAYHHLLLLLLLLYRMVDFVMGSRPNRG